MAEYKICSKCEKSKPDTPEVFRKRKDRKSSEAICRDCERAYARKQSREYYKNNKERARRTNKKWYENNKEKMREYNKGYHKKYYAEHKEELMEKQRQYRKDNDRVKKHAQKYYQKNKAWINERNRKWREKNRDKIKKLIQDWFENNKEKRREYNQTRGARLRELKADLTVEQWELIQDYFANACAYCGEETKLCQDHFVPVNSGGGYTLTNIIPACQFCNSSKHDNDFFEWYPTFGHYGEERLEKIYKFFVDVKRLGQ
jgi:hypothetical protein